MRRLRPDDLLLSHSPPPPGGDEIHVIYSPLSTRAWMARATMLAGVLTTRANWVAGACSTPNNWERNTSMEGRSAMQHGICLEAFLAHEAETYLRFLGVFGELLDHLGGGGNFRFPGDDRQLAAQGP